MNILVCPDKFKGSLTAQEVCRAVSKGFLAIDRAIMVQSVPLADGGEGTRQLLTEWSQGSEITLRVRGPLFTPVTARYGLSSDGKTAFIEMADASGLMLIPPEARNPLLTTTFGTGELIADALKRNVRDFVLGIGGSATNDAGIGMAAALGFEFLDVDEKQLNPIGENLRRIHRIDTRRVNPLLKDARFITLCDVTNPLYGPDGAAEVYGPQKGAGKAAIEILDAGLLNFEAVVRQSLKRSANFPGAGAAGGLGAGCKVFLNAAIENGVGYVVRTVGLADKIAESDLVVTGEGKIDRQTFSGKVVSEVIRLARLANRPVIAVCGVSEVSEAFLREQGIVHVISLVDNQTSAETAMHHGFTILSRKIAAECKTLPLFK